jgi:hypothetical protein
MRSSIIDVLQKRSAEASYNELLWNLGTKRQWATSDTRHIASRTRAILPSPSQLGDSFVRKPFNPFVPSILVKMESRPSSPHRGHLWRQAPVLPIVGCILIPPIKQWEFGQKSSYLHPRIRPSGKCLTSALMGPNSGI